MNWTPPQQNEIYFFRACYVPVWPSYDYLNYRPSEARFVAVEGDLVPLSILFDVSPKDFSPGTDITLSANVSNTATGEPVPDDCPVRFYKVYSDGYCESVGVAYTDSGIAELPWTYPSGLSGALAFYAEVDAQFPTQKVITSPVMLNVGDSTRLLLWIDRSESSTVHTIRGRLKSGETGVWHKIVTIKVNETSYDIETDEYGNLSKAVNMPPRSSEATTYTVTASFNGTNPCNNSAFDYTLNGTRYDVCTTIKYDLKPVSNSTWLKAYPDGTTQTQPTKTPEEMQQEAQNSGWLSIWPEFSLWYPWFRLHIEVDVNPRIHVGFSPILPGGEVWDWEGLEIFADLANEFMQELIIDVWALFIEYVVAKGLSMIPFTWVPAVAVLAFKASTQLFFLLQDWNSPPRMLAITIVNAIMGIMASRVSIGIAFINALFTIIYRGQLPALLQLQNMLVAAAEPVQYVRTWVDWIEIGMDFGFTIIALVRFLDLIGVL